MAGSSAPPVAPKASALTKGFVNVFKRNSLFAGVVFGGSFAFAIFWDAVRSASSTDAERSFSARTGHPGAVGVVQPRGECAHLAPDGPF
jgi:hypothetical protein